MTTVEKKMVFRCQGWRVSRELYSPDDEMSKMMLEAMSAHYRKAHFVFEDLLHFHNYGWKICYTGKASKRLHLIKAEYLGEENNSDL